MNHKRQFQAFGEGALARNAALKRVAWTRSCRRTCAAHRAGAEGPAGYRSRVNAQFKLVWRRAHEYFPILYRWTGRTGPEPLRDGPALGDSREGLERSGLGCHDFQRKNPDTPAIQGEMEGDQPAGVSRGCAVDTAESAPQSAWVSISIVVIRACRKV